MTNSLTLLEIVNEACEEARQGELSNLGEETPLARRSRRHYKRTFQRLVSSYPWPYLTKRVELVQDANHVTTGASAYRYRYQIPRDAAFLWDIYRTPSNYRQYGYLWDYGSYRAYAFPYDDHSALMGDTGELVNGGVESNYSQMFCLYTPKVENPLTYNTLQLTQQFVEVLIKEMAILYEGDNNNVELKKLNIAQHKSDIREMKTLSAIQNRKAQKITQPHVISLIDRYRRF